MTHSKWHPKAPLSSFFCLEIACLMLALLFDRWPRGKGAIVLVNAKLLLRSSASCSHALLQADKDTTTFSEIWLPKNCQSKTSSSIRTSLFITPYKSSTSMTKMQKHQLKSVETKQTSSVTTEASTNDKKDQNPVSQGIQRPQWL